MAAIFPRLERTPNKPASKLNLLLVPAARNSSYSLFVATLCSAGLLEKQVTRLSARGAILCQSCMNVETRKSCRLHLVQTKVWEAGPLRILVVMCIPIGIEAAPMQDP
jgi:hypothetical protein